MAGEPKRSAQSIISEAISENAFGERLLYGFSISTFIIGAIVLGIGAYRGEGVTSAVGAAFGTVFYPVMRIAKSIRDQNLAIRLLEIPLNNARTAEEAAQILRRFFEATIPATSKAEKKGLPKP